MSLHLREFGTEVTQCAYADLDSCLRALGAACISLLALEEESDETSSLSESWVAKSDCCWGNGRKKKMRVRTLHKNPRGKAVLKVQEHDAVTALGRRGKSPGPRPRRCRPPCPYERQRGRRTQSAGAILIEIGHSELKKKLARLGYGPLHHALQCTPPVHRGPRAEWRHH